MIFWKYREIKYTGNLIHNNDPQNVTPAKFKFLMKASDLREILGKLSKINFVRYLHYLNKMIKNEKVHFQ